MVINAVKNFSYKKMLSRFGMKLEFYDCIFLEDFRDFKEGDKVIEIKINIQNKIMIVKKNYTEREHKKYEIQIELKVF